MSLTLDLGVWTRGLLTRVRVYPEQGQAQYLAGGTIQGSQDGTAFVTLVTFGPDVLDGWNVVEVGEGLAPTQRPAYRYLR